MLTLKKKTYRPMTLPLLCGQAHGIKIRLRDYPIRQSDDGKKRIEYFAHFNMMLIDALWNKIPDFEVFRARACEDEVRFSLNIAGCPPVILQIQIGESQTKKLFHREVTDAIMAALESESIGNG